MKEFKKISIIIPCYNEEKTIGLLIEKVLSVSISIDKELIVIDDSSCDNSTEIVEKYQSFYPNIKLFINKKNKGKGYSIRQGFEQATGDIILIQDADLEYDPMEYNKLINPILENKADVVYGSRFIGGSQRRILFFWHYLGNKFLTILSNIFTNLNLSDMETCYKVFTKEIIKKIKLKEDRFGFEPEITAKIAKLECRIYEVGITYFGRTYKEGKKVNWKDGFRAIFVIIRDGLFD